MSLENMTADLKWCLFRGIVCELLEKNGYNADKWEMANCLDMSFEFLSDIPVEEWKGHLEGELIEYKSNEGKRFFNVHH